MTYTVILGGTKFIDCSAVLVINGIEVFRLRERTGDGQLTVDFEIRDEADKLLAKVAKNNIVFPTDGKYAIDHGKTHSTLIDQSSGNEIAKVAEVSQNTISITGTFCIDGDKVIATDDQLVLPRGNSFFGSTFSGFSKAIEITEGEIALGISK